MADKTFVNPFKDVHQKALALRDRYRKIREEQTGGLRAKEEEREEALKIPKKPIP